MITQGWGEILFSGDTDMTTFDKDSEIGFATPTAFGARLTRKGGRKPSMFASLPISSLEYRDERPTNAGYCDYGFGILVWDDWGNITRFYFANRYDHAALLAECEANLPRKER
jgi:hypothetical protein